MAATGLERLGGLELIHKCPSCSRVIARSRSKRTGAGQRLEPLPGVALEVKTGIAPRLKCWCGRVLILLKGAL